MISRLALCAFLLLLAGPVLVNPVWAGTNEYGGYDIFGGIETAYGETRGWKVSSATVDGKFAYCAGELADGDTVWRLGYDNMQWQLGVPYAPSGDGPFEGQYEVDGKSMPMSGVAANGWSFMWLGLQELDEVRGGSEIVLDIGRASIEHPLVGTAAVITKVEECVDRKGAGSGGAARLPGTGLSLEQAAALIGRPAPAAEFGEYYAGCSWALNETPFAAGDYLLYYAASCKGRTSRLDFAGGAQFAELTVADSAYAAYAEEPFTPADHPLVRIGGAEPGDPEGSVLSRARGAIEDPALAAKCEVRSGEPWGYPADSYVVDVSPEYAATLSEDERMMGVCGPLGSGDSAAFWRVFQGFSWFFDLGQDAWQDIDPASLTLVTPDGKDGWKKVE